MLEAFSQFLDGLEAKYPSDVYDKTRALYHSIMEASFMPRDAVIQSTVDPMVSGGGKNTPIPNSNDADDSRGEYPNPAVPGTCTKENPVCTSEMPKFAKGAVRTPRANWFNATFTTQELMNNSKGFSKNDNLADKKLQSSDAKSMTRHAIENAKQRIPFNDGTQVIEDAVPRSGMFPMTGINIHAGFGTHTSTDVGYQSGGGGGAPSGGGEG